MNERIRRSIAEYSRELPDGVRLRHEPQFAQYRLIMVKPGAKARFALRQATTLATFKQTTVLAWQRPERVFASVARRRIREQSKEEDHV